VRGPRTRSGARLAGATAALVFACVSAAAAASPPTDTLRREVGVLEARTHSALLDLYALDSRLDAARARLASLQSQAARLRAQEVLLRQQLAATRRTLAVSQGALGQNLRRLYKQGGVSTLAVVLGARSLDDAMTQLDDIGRVADELRRVSAATATAKARLLRVRRLLATRRTRVDAAVGDARRTAVSLDVARAERLGFIARLRSEEQLKTTQIRTLEASAARVVRTSSELQAAATGSAPDLPAPATAPATGTLTVSATGYSLSGATSTGMPAGWGVVAVDPSVIALGTRVTIPGYGDAVAADVGNAVRGDAIDLWFPTPADAQAWGRRTVTITLH
jgi:3D (Asp-Asp-Asp) domain-containing protein